MCVKRILSIVLVIVLAFSATSYIYADEYVVREESGELLSVKLIGNNIAVFSDSRSSIMLTTTASDSMLKVNIVDLTTGKKDYMLRDENSGTLYSSITGNTVALLSSGSLTSIGDHPISYRTLASIAGYTAGAATIAAAITAYCGLPLVATVLGVIAGLMTIISTGLSTQSSTKGIKYTVGWVTIKKHQGGRIITSTVKRVTNVKTY